MKHANWHGILKCKMGSLSNGGGKMSCCYVDDGMPYVEKASKLDGVGHGQRR